MIMAISRLSVVISARFIKNQQTSKKRSMVVLNSVNISYHDVMPDNMTDRGIFGI